MFEDAFGMLKDNYDSAAMNVPKQAMLNTYLRLWSRAKAHSCLRPLNVTARLTAKYRDDLVYTFEDNEFT